MKWLDNFDLFLFDMDGLLVDTECLHYKAFMKMCEGIGYPVDWDFKAYCNIAHSKSNGIKDALYSKFPDLYKKEPEFGKLKIEKNRVYCNLLKTSKINLMPGVEIILDSILKKNKSVCVVTNSSKEEADIIKSKTILNKIPNWITRESYENPKPSPEGYLKAICLFGKGKKKFIGFEDSIKGINALLETPAVAVFINNMNHKVDLDRVKRFNSFFEFLEKFSS